MKITGYYTNDNHLFSKLSGSGGEEAKKYCLKVVVEILFLLNLFLIPEAKE